MYFSQLTMMSDLTTHTCYICPFCHACTQENFSTVPKRVWADVVRKLGVKTNSGNTAADLYVHVHPHSFLHF